MHASTREIRDAFHRQLYHHFTGLEWQGVLTLKTPMDLMVYQEILFERRPDLIIETGSYKGGSALFMAHVCDLLGHGQIVSVDLERPTSDPARPAHPRITWLEGNSVAGNIVAAVAGRRAAVSSAMVILDSDHRAAHVRRELYAYADFVSVGDYVIVEDTNVGGHPVYPEHGPGPWEAVGEFLSRRHDFLIDVAREKFLVSFNPGGYLKRVA